MATADFTVWPVLNFSFGCCNSVHCALTAVSWDEAAVEKEKQVSSLVLLERCPELKVF